MLEFLLRTVQKMFSYESSTKSLWKSQKEIASGLRAVDLNISASKMFPPLCRVPQSVCFCRYYYKESYLIYIRYKEGKKNNNTTPLCVRITTTVLFIPFFFCCEEFEFIMKILTSITNLSTWFYFLCSFFFLFFQILFAHLRVSDSPHSPLTRKRTNSNKKEFI